MILGSHNSWSYLPLQQWWLKLFAFMSRCQQVDIKTQYEEYGVRCFDLRIRKNKKSNYVIAHGYAEYKYSEESLYHDLEWINKKGDCYVRVLHEVRNKKQCDTSTTSDFCSFCQSIENRFKDIRFWCGRNLYNWNVDYKFDNEPSCEEKYASVCLPKYIDDWCPWIYARLNNKHNIANQTGADILLIDYVNIQ